MAQLENASKFMEQFQVRNLGFVNESEQTQLSSAKVFVCGVGGMGGACLESIVRMGVQNVGICDIDVFETSNLNRQIYCNLDSIGVEKSVATENQIKKINPYLQVKNWGEKWLDNIEEIFQTYDLVVNGCDDVRSTLMLYRMGRKHKKTIIDAFASPLPSVYVTQPGEPMPEEWLKYPTCDTPPESWTDVMLQECFQKELEYVIANTSSEKHIHMKYAIELFEGKRGRMSLAPMVILTGNLMAYEVYYHLTHKPSQTTHKGFFLNTQANTIEKGNFFFVRWLKKRFLKKALQS